MTVATLCFRNRVDEGGTLSEPSAVASLPVTNLRTRVVAQKARFSTASPVIRFDAGTAVSARQVSLWGLSSPALASFTLKAGTTAGASNVASLTAGTLTAGQAYQHDPTFGHVVADLGVAFSARHWEIAFTQTGASFIDVGRLYLGPVLSVSVDIGFPFDLDAERPSRIFRGLAGAQTVYVIPDRRIYGFTWDGTGMSDADLFQTLTRDLDAHVSNWRQVVFCPQLGTNPLGIRHACLGTLEPGIGQVIGVNQRAKFYRIIEAG